MNRIVEAVEADASLVLAEEDLHNSIYILSEGIHSDANAALAWDVVERLPHAYRKSLSPGQTVQVGAKDLQMTLAWSTPTDPFLTGSTPKSIAALLLIRPHAFKGSASRRVVTVCGVAGETAPTSSSRNVDDVMTSSVILPSELMTSASRYVVLRCAILRHYL